MEQGRVVAEAAYEGWAIVELMGHRQRAGRVKEVEMAGGKLLRVDIPTGPAGEPESFITEFYGCAAIYALRPCTEKLARDFVDSRGDPRPANPLDYRPSERKGLPYDDPDFSEVS